MTLRHRLLLVYLIVVLLSVATVGVTAFEFNRARRIFGALQPWNDMALGAQKLQSLFGHDRWPALEDQQLAFVGILVGQYPKLAEAADYRAVDPVREALNNLNRRFQSWRELPESEKPGESAAVRQALLAYAELVDLELTLLHAEAAQQETRRIVLLLILAGLTMLHVLVIGSLLRRWLIRPLERLNRQVEALARGQPPPDPLLTSPLEMASLAEALDRARQSLRNLQQKLIESERMTTIGQFAAQLAHNLRNPLASIRATAQLTARQAGTAPNLPERMTEIIVSVDRMNSWIAGLMEVAHERPTAARAADVTPILAGVASALTPELAAKGLRLTLNMPPGGLVCLYEPATLEHTLIAMVVNAIEASPLGETIELRAERLEPDQPAHTAGADAQSREPSQEVRVGRCRISVIDRGAGLPSDQPERIFEFAYSTKQKGMGLGLGLARQALQRQGGKAGAWNNPDGGATVFVELPAG